MKLKIILLTLSFLILALSLTGGYFYYQNAKSYAVQENHNLIDSHVAKMTADLNAIINAKKSAVSRLAAKETLRQALQDPSPATTRAANTVLAESGHAFPDSVFYLINAQGNTLAASNLKEPDSFVGHNYGFRPYFQEAIQGRPALFLGVGVTSKKPGIYLAYPVTEKNTAQIIGVAVGKFSINEAIEKVSAQPFQLQHGMFFLTGPYSIILSSNHQELTGKFLWEPPAEAREKIAATKQFGSGPWSRSGLRKITGKRAIDPEGHEFTIHQNNLGSIPGWNLTFLHDDAVFNTIISRTLITTIGTTLFIFLSVLCGLVILLYLTASEEIRARIEAEKQLLDNQKNLESLVEKRTGEYLDANQELQVELEKHDENRRKLLHSNRSLEIINKVLSLAHQTLSLQDFFNEFLQFASSFSEFGLLPKGALFLVDEDKPETLQMMAHYNLTAPLPKLCNQVPFGHCLCGRAAATGKIVFASHIDERHDNTYEGIQPHGHYCIPIFSRSNRVLGVYNVYTKNNAAHDERLEDLLTSVASVLANIIEHKTAERQSLESHAKHRAITNTASDSIIMIDHHGQITFWNPAAEKLFGYNRSEVLGQDLHNLIAPPKYREKAHTGFKDFITTGQGPLIGKTLEMSGLKKDGTTFPVELSTSAVKQGNHWAAIAILRDISARKDLEGEKLKIAQQIRQAQKMEAIGTLAGGIAHDFNNILSSILGYAELVKEDMSPTCIESLHDLDQVIIAGKRAKELVKQILTFSRQTEEEAQPIQISLVIKETIKLLQATLPKNIEIQQMISAGSEVVLCDPSQIHQLIMNLCTNSYQAMRDAGGTLEVRLESFSPDDTFVENHPDLPAARYLRLTVSDTGQGIGPAVLPRIFEPYFSTKKKGEGGTGLGLAVAHGIVKRLAGAIEVNSELGVGTIFKVYLPVLNEQISPDKPLPDLPIHGSENILLVDDELSLLELEERTLAPLGYKTVCRTSSIEALELFRNDPDRFDLVVTDHNMPNMTGAQMAEEMVNIRPDIPIILCTGYSELDISAAIMGKCIRKTIMKPVSKKELAHSIREVLGRNRNQ